MTLKRQKTLMGREKLATFLHHKTLKRVKWVQHILNIHVYNKQIKLQNKISFRDLQVKKKELCTLIYFGMVKYIYKNLPHI